MRDPVTVRKLKSSDRAFVATRWICDRLGGETRRRKFARQLDIEHGSLPPVLGKRYGLLVDDLLDEGETLVICSSEDDDTLLGFVCVARGLLCMAYLEPKMRGRGIGKQMLESIRTVTTNSLHPTTGFQWDQERLKQWMSQPRATAA